MFTKTNIVPCIQRSGIENKYPVTQISTDLNFVELEFRKSSIIIDNPFLHTNTEPLCSI